MNEEWNDWALHQINIRAKYNQDYQQMRSRWQELDELFQTVCAGLPKQDREAIEDYIAMCENLEYMRSQIAYEFGKEVGRKQASVSLVQPK